MRHKTLPRQRLRRAGLLLFGLTATVVIGTVTLNYSRVLATPRPGDSRRSELKRPDSLAFRERQWIDTSGLSSVVPRLKSWPLSAPLDEIAESWKNVGHRIIASNERFLGESPALSEARKVNLRLTKAMLLNYEGEPAKACEELSALRASLEGKPVESADWLYTIIYYQGVSSLRRGENENCIMCRGESSCILPISPAAVHRNPRGSRTAIK
ncbi:MAG: hypothetical protein P4L84_11635, partial [Isosphaeraceae bacterium]|nr:hypothetical protein [Isosphaeraceae bacterium]